MQYRKLGRTGLKDGVIGGGFEGEYQVGYVLYDFWVCASGCS